MSSTPATFPITSGTTFYNKYQPTRLLGRGAFGEVWLAKDHAVNHEYAIKILNAGIAIDERLREAQIGHAFEHNNLVRVHQADVTTDGKVVIAMDYFPNGSVTTLANPGNFLPLPLAIRTMIDVLQGLEHLHLNNFFHNDVKPQNILRGPQGQAKLADYGIVGVSSDGGAVMPSNWYILHAAPETVAGNGIETRTDIFQCGLTFFRLLVGLGELEARYSRLGKADYTSAIAKGQLLSKNDFPPFIPASVARVVQSCIDPNPDKRYQSALEFRRALEKLSFIGCWTVDASGDLVGANARHAFRYEHVAGHGSNGYMKAYKRNISSGRETRISQYTKGGLTQVECTKLVDGFIRGVVEGRVI